MSMLYICAANHLQQDMNHLGKVVNPALNGASFSYRNRTPNLYHYDCFLLRFNK